MADPLVVPEVVRYTAFGQIHDRPWVNVWDITIPEGRPAADDIMDDLAAAVLDSYFNRIRGLLGSAWQIQGVRWVDLNSVGGAVGSITDTAAASTFPAAGTNTASEACANQVSVIVTKNTTGGRSQRRGRCYIPGVIETSTTGPNLGNKASWDTAWNSFLSDISAPISAVAVQPCVVHRPASFVPSKTPITSLSVQSRLGTMRRRLRA